ncbi:restriction endonuclease subunit S [Treponema berlinense]|uniref:restriction endonuclease subunit S n=1 Tax=Treponema berlinense TaxID=225004 RepID=UPI0023575DD3|nr:restriction endonuclease subunit S [Treponema berlinense]
MEKKLGEIAERVTRKNKNNETPLPLTISSKDGLVDQVTYFNKTVASKDMSGYYLLKNGEFAYNKSYSVGYDFGSIKRLDKYPMGALSTLYICFSIKNFDSDFMKVYFDSLKWYREIYLIAAEGARNHGLLNISTEDFFETKHKLPLGLPEQKKIAAFFMLLDRRIQKQRQLVESLKTYKRGVIKQYFSAQKDNTKWTKSTISNCLFYEQPQKYIVHSEHYSNTYETPVLTANKAFILGYTNELDGIYDKGDVLIYDDFTMEVKYVDFPFKVKSSTIKMLTPQSGIDLYFMFTLLKSLDLQPEGHQRSYISILEPMEVNIPCYEEQARASGIFRLLDKQIEKEQQLLHKILDLKSSLLQKMFI